MATNLPLRSGLKGTRPGANAVFYEKWQQNGHPCYSLAICPHVRPGVKIPKLQRIHANTHTCANLVNSYWYIRSGTQWWLIRSWPWKIRRSGCRRLAVEPSNRRRHGLGALSPRLGDCEISAPARTGRGRRKGPGRG